MIPWLPYIQMENVYNGNRATLVTGAVTKDSSIHCLGFKIETALVLPKCALRVHYKKKKQYQHLRSPSPGIC